MRLAIIADIHGNIHALEAVLADIDMLGVDQVVVNGDMVNRAPKNIEVLERLFSEPEFVMTRGNHDDLMRKWIERDPDLPPDWFDDPFWKGTAWAAQQIDEAGWLDRLRNLPMTVQVEQPNSPTLLVSHGSPRHYREGYGTFLANDKFDEIASAYPADIWVGSHTHRPFELVRKEQTFLNTGAVGAPFNKDPRAQYLLMTLQQHQWEWEFRAVAYDKDAALATYEETGYVPEGELSAFIFREELRYSTPLYIPFWMWSEKQNKTRTWAAWHEFWSAYKERLLSIKNLKELRNFL